MLVKFVFLFIFSCPYHPSQRNFPVYGDFGINTGVIFMKLDAMRKFGFIEKIIDIRDKFREVHLRYADQDLMVIFLSYYPGNINHIF